MNKRNSKVEEIDGNVEISIHAVTVYHIFRECFKKCGILSDDGSFEKRQWPRKLKERMMLEMPEYGEMYWAEYQNYMRDRYNETRRFIEEDKNPRRTMGFERYRFAPLLSFPGIADYKKLDDALMSTVKIYNPVNKIVINHQGFTAYTAGNKPVYYPHQIAASNLTILIF